MVILEREKLWRSSYAGDVKMVDGSPEHIIGVVPTVEKAVDDPIGNGGNHHPQML